MTRAESSKGSMNGSLSGSTQSLTTVGRINHDPTRHQAPSFSFGTRLPDRIRPSPGPQYNVAGDLSYRGTGHKPSYSLGRRYPRSVFDVDASEPTPGPNAYAVPTAINKAPMYSFGLQHHDPYRRRPAPAPNAYNLPSTLGWSVPHLRGAPASTLGGKGSQNKGFSYDHAKTPGPAGYGSVDPGLTTRRAPAVTLTGRTKLPPIKFVTPGPGAYDQSKGYSAVTKSSPRISMGVRHGENVKPLFTLADVSD